MATRMVMTARAVATSLALGFCLYFVARGMWWIEPPQAPPLLLGALALYLVIMLLGTLTPDGEGGRMPQWVAIAALLCAAAISALASLALSPALRQAPFATWYIGAVGLLGVVCVVRRRAAFGWGVLGILAVSAMVWMGPLDALSLGLVGSIVWMLATQLLVWLWARAMRDTERLTSIQQRSSSWQATQQVRQSERRRRVQYALAVAGPVLTRTVASGGRLSDEERSEARRAEARLRDELRGGGLLDDAVRAAIDDARCGGATVTLLDEGGLDDLSESRRAQIRGDVAAALREAQGLRVIVRAARHSETAVTVVGRAGSAGSSDDDAVGLWRAIPRQDPDADPSP